MLAGSTFGCLNIVPMVLAPAVWMLVALKQENPPVLFWRVYTLATGQPNPGQYPQAGEDQTGPAPTNPQAGGSTPSLHPVSPGGRRAIAFNSINAMLTPGGWGGFPSQDSSPRSAYQQPLRRGQRLALSSGLRTQAACIRLLACGNLCVLRKGKSRR